MIKLLLILLLAGLLVLGLTLLKVYKFTPEKELKRHAREGDQLSEALFNVAAFGLNVDILLWFIIGISGGLLFDLIATNSSFWLAALSISGLLWFGFAWLPRSRSSIMSRTIAKYCAKPLVRLLNILDPILRRIEKMINKYRPLHVHTGLYTRDDLLDLLRQQKGQLDNRISKEDLFIARNALSYGDKTVQDVMVPRRVIKSVDINETVGPILMGELHKSGHSRFPVYEDKKNNFVGILYMRDMLNSRAGGMVKNIMEQRVYFVHDESSLGAVLQAFLKTHHHMFLVVNSFEEVVGLITMEDVLEQIIGKPIIDEFDAYDDMRAVAANLAKKEHKAQDEVAKPSPKSSEVIE